MKKWLLLGFFLLAVITIHAQCLVNSLTINTGYNPLTGLAIPGGANGATPVTDPKWILTAVTPGVATAIAATGIPGLIEVVPGNAANIITSVGGWVTNPTANPGRWISCLNSNQYLTDGGGVTAYDMTLGRPFRMCSDDNITIDVFIANDNYVQSTNIDGVPLSFFQPAGTATSNYTTYSHFTQTVFLTAGTHTLNIVVSNFNVPGATLNPTGLDLYGTVSSSTGISSLVSESSAACGSFVCSVPPACSNTVSLADTIKTCAGSVVTLSATLTGTDPVISTLWSPVTGLSDPTILAPVLTASTSLWYYLTVKSLLQYNLVNNGDFSAGNSGFSSSYVYSAPPSTTLVEGHYSVYTNPNGVHSGFTSFGDHTTGTGNMMILNAASTPVDVWCQTIAVVPNTDYNFSAWIANCSGATVGADVPILQFKINGVLQGVPTTVTAAPGTWVNFFVTWNSGPSTTANICINDALTTASGNDFVIDDISFQQICKIVDSVYIDATALDTVFVRHDTSICSAAVPITLLAPAGYTTRTWNTGSTAGSINVTLAGTYWVTSTTGCSSRIDTFHVNFYPNPVVNLGNDTGFCIGNTYLLTSVQPAGSSYAWSTGSTDPGINVSSSGSYVLTVTNSDGCVGTDIINILVSPPPIVDLGADTIECEGIPLSLHSSVTYSSPAYLWNDFSTGPGLIAVNSGTYWLQVTVAGCAAADTIHVQILYDTFTLHNTDTAICIGRSIQVFTDGNPDITYQWRPTAGIPVSDISSPLISPDTSAMYVVTASMAGCPDLQDSFFVDVQPIPTLYIGGNRDVCEYDTLRLNAFVSPLWYTHYSYSWSPATAVDFPGLKTVVFRASDTTNVILTVTTPAGCKAVDSALLIVHPGNFATAVGDTDVCPRDSVQLWASGAASYRWTPAMYLSDPAVPDPWVKAITSQDYALFATSNYGCQDTLYMRVTVHPGAVLYLGDSVAIAPGGSYQIAPQTNCSYFLWSPAAGLDSRYISNPLATPSVSTKYVVHASTEWGCRIVDTFNVYIDPNSAIAVPNAFSPGDGINGKLFVLRKGLVSLNHFRVYNRWGNMVFETTNIENGWDGTYNGVPQPVGVFVYDVEAKSMDGTILKKQGNVTLLR